MKFGTVDINTKDVDFTTWTFEEFKALYNSALKGHVKESLEEVAKALGMVIPEKVKPDKVKTSGDA